MTPLLPVDGRIEEIEERISQDNALFSQRCNVKALEFLPSCVEDPKPAIVGDLSLAILHFIYVVQYMDPTSSRI